MSVPHIALTGGVGAGKSTVSSMFRSLGIPVFDLDRICHSLINNPGHTRDAIVSSFGKDILDKNHVISRQKLGKIVFADTDKRKKLEQILHPAAAEFVQQQSLLVKSSPYTIIEIPLLRDRNNYHKVLLVTTSDDSERIARVQQRDARSAEQVQAIIEAQPATEKLQNMADHVIHNDDDIAALGREVARLHQLLLRV